MRFLKHFILSTLVCLSGFEALSAAEAVSNEKIVAALEKTEVLGSGQKLVAKVSGNEATISTYRHRESKDKDTDCKIDASLVARALMINNDFGLRRVIVHFHEPDLTGNYREVIVSYAEIKAFATGAVQQVDFLSSLTLNLLPEAVNKNTAAEGDNKTAADSGVAASKATASAGETAPAEKNDVSGNSSQASPESARKLGAAEPVAGAAGGQGNQKKEAALPRYLSHATGISFNIPAGWSVEDKFPPGGGLYFKLHSRATKMNNIEFGVSRSSQTPAQSALAMKKKFTYEGVRFEKYETTRFGLGKYEGALIVLQYPHESNQQYYEMHLYFGKPGAVFDMWGWCPISQYSIVGSAFFEVMNSMSFPAVHGGSAPAQSGAKPAGSRKR
jgi:hypothetical protein